MTRAFTFNTGRFANGDKAVLFEADGSVWTIHWNDRRTRITRGAMAGRDALAECLNMVAEGSWIEIDPPGVPAAPADLPAAYGGDHW